VNSFEAVLHYGMTKDEPPTAAQLRDQFFATVIAGDNMGDGFYQDLAGMLMRAYALAWDHEQEEEADEPTCLECVDNKEAERIFREAYGKVWIAKTNWDEIPDGQGWFDFVPYHFAGEVYPVRLMVDTGHLLAYYELAKDKAMAEYFKSQEGRERLKSHNIDPDTVVPR
jgi:hypothetical protein